MKARTKSCLTLTCDGCHVHWDMYGLQRLAGKLPSGQLGSLDGDLDSFPSKGKSDDEVIACVTTSDEGRLRGFKRNTPLRNLPPLGLNQPCEKKKEVK